MINCCCLFVQKQWWKLIGQLFKIVAGKLAKCFSWKWIKFLLRWNECSPDCNWGLAKTQESWHRDRKVSKDFKVILGLKLGQDILQLRSYNHNNWKYGVKDTGKLAQICQDMGKSAKTLNKYLGWSLAKISFNWEALTITIGNMVWNLVCIDELLWADIANFDCREL